MLERELKVLIYFFLYVDLIPCETQSPCLNGGICENNGAGGYTCVCSSNYLGINCETLVNHCDPNPCQNDGVCTVSFVHVLPYFIE